MTNGPALIDAQPKLIPARVSIHHLQLRDLLQPAGVKDRVLFVNRLKIEQADFTSLKPPTTYCTLDFLPNCLTASCGLLAAGGQHSELALRPLHSPSSAAASHELDTDRYPAPWLLRTPTGGSINNAISIQPDSLDPSSFPSSSTSSYPAFAFASSSSTAAATSASSSAASASRSRQRIQVGRSSFGSSTAWARDEPRRSEAQRHPLRQSEGTNEWEVAECAEQDDTAAAYGHNPTAYLSSTSSSPWQGDASQRQASHLADTDGRSAAVPALAQAGPVKIMVSNNDQSIKSYKLRPPQGSPGAGGRIESGLPGLTKTNTLHFPTAINHSSLSPDRRTLIAVGDTPEVFVYHVRRDGEFDKVATYTASTDASFSTTWSPDGSKFAVASQDGIVSVWDVRSSRPLASLSTWQAGMAGGNGAARVAKFSPNGDMLAFTEHRKYFHVVDTVTFGSVQRVAAPVCPTTSGASAVAGAGGGIADDDEATGAAPQPPAAARMGLTGMGLLTNPSSTPNRMQVLLNAVHAHSEATTVLDRFRITSSATPPSYASYDSLVHQRIGPDDVAQPYSSSLEESARSGGGGGGGGGGGALLLEDDAIRAGSGSGSTRRRPESASVNISGLCWDPEGDHVYVSTERVIARYTVLDPRQPYLYAPFL
ncbi:hypothetical protein ACQY0O_004712 [Thecaphora frezii]